MFSPFIAFINGYPGGQTWFSLQESYSLGRDLFSSKIMTRSKQRNLHGNVLKTTKGECDGERAAESKPGLWSSREIVDWLVKGLFTPDPRSTWQNRSRFAKEIGVKLQSPDVKSLIETRPHRLSAPEVTRRGWKLTQSLISHYVFLINWHCFVEFCFHSHTQGVLFCNFFVLYIFIDHLQKQ